MTDEDINNIIVNDKRENREEKENYVLFNKNEEKLSLRKNKNNLLIKQKRNINIAMSEYDLKNILPDQQFKLENFSHSYSKILEYLTSNNIDLISYCLFSLKIYFCYNEPNQKDQNLIIETNFFDLLLNISNNLLSQKKENIIEYVLTILINIQIYSEGSNEYFKELYNEKYINFYFNCVMQYKDTISKIIKIIYFLLDNFKGINLIILRSDIFKYILKYAECQKQFIEDEKENLLNLFAHVMDLINYEDLLTKSDIKIINTCLNLLIQEIYGSTGSLLKITYEALFNISSLDDKFELNKKLINEGVTLKIMKMKFCSMKVNEDSKAIMINALKILANNLTATDKEAEIIYERNIIDYYNNILNSFDDDKKVIEIILRGIANICGGSKREIIKDSIIWNQVKIEKYLNFNDEIKSLYIAILKYWLYNADFDMLKFVYDKKVLQYLMYLFTVTDLNEYICVKILKIVDVYLKKFQNNKNCEEYMVVYKKLEELFQFSEKIYSFHKNKQIIDNIIYNIKNNYC